MGRISLIVTVCLVVIASTAMAGTFDVLSEAGGVRAPLFLKPGSVVKAEFKSNLGRYSDVEEDANSVRPESNPSVIGPSVMSRPAGAVSKRARNRIVASPDSAKETSSGIGALSQNRSGGDSLEEELEKDLIISPPPPQTETGPAAATESPASPTSVVSDSAKKETASQVKRRTHKRARSSVSRQRQTADARSFQGIRKVRPITNRAWGVPAGNHGPNVCSLNPRPSMDEPAQRLYIPQTTRSFVRDGVRVKLAPKPVAASYPDRDDEYGPNVLDSVAEVIGLPFAFISSLF